MLRKIDISNYKSISTLPIELGRFNVFIGENGAGKSNILEAIALASAAANFKLDNEFLAARGIRVTRSELMRSGFRESAFADAISVTAVHETKERIDFSLQNDNQPYSKWTAKVSRSNPNIDQEYFRSSLRAIVAQERESESQDGEFVDQVTQALLAIEEMVEKAKQNGVIKLSNRPNQSDDEDLSRSRFGSALRDLMRMSASKNSFLEGAFKDFLIYSPENSALRAFEREGQVEPLGINGEGLLKLIHVHASGLDQDVIPAIKASLKILGWFEDFSPSAEISDERLIIKDKYLENFQFPLDQKSANEGFLFLLFYFALFTSKLTPKFFAVDNIDASLNPKLCQKLTTELVRLSKANDKQVIVTTHNPAILDGLNLDDDEQRLFVVSRGRDGSTRLKRIKKPASDGAPYRLSELFLRGVLGGLPKGF